MQGRKQAWKEQGRENKGLLISIDGIQPDAGSDRLKRLKTIIGLHEEKKEVLASITMIHTWVLEAEDILGGSWVHHPEEITNHAVGQLFDAYLDHLFQFLNGEEITEDEKGR